MFKRDAKTVDVADALANVPVLQGGQNALIEAIHRSSAVIEFEPDGTILTANENFLEAMGYTLSEVQGQHHRLFVEPEFAGSAEYRDFWAHLQAGDFQAAEFKRLAKGGRPIWIQASYNPILDTSGQVVKVVKLATDITPQKMRNALYEAKMHAIDRSQAVIEFKPDGTIVHANENFLKVMGYSLEEIRGEHHRIFVEPAFAKSPEYQQFWQKLNGGEFQTSEYKRLAKGGEEVWIQASYNPLYDANGELTGVIKFASDITEQVQSRRRTQDGVVQSVARSVAEIKSTINEISESVQKTADLAKTSETYAESTMREVEFLSEGSQKIGSIVSVIQDLADQTHLLALNATIEAARAGEAGQSFAVVASEVKHLASGTADAIKNIETVVKELQSNITSVVGSNTEITTSIAEVSTNTTAIAAAIEEQSAAIDTLSQTANVLLSSTGDAA